jgi:hypothetical protein
MGKEMHKLLFIFIGIFILCSIFVQAANYPPSDLGRTIHYTESVIICNGCFANGKCYNIGARLTMPPLFPNRDLAWRNESYLYCGDDSTQFVPQKIIREKCENGFECQSNKCNEEKCEQNSRMKEIEIYDDKITIVKNLLFTEKEIFHFKGLNKDYSIGFGENHSNYVFLVDNNISSYENKTFNLNDNSQFIFNSIIFEGNTTKANVTFIESKNPIGDPEEFLSNLWGNKEETAELKNETIQAPITGNVINDKKGNFLSDFFEFLKNLFA